MVMDSNKYNVFGMVTNMDWDSQDLIPWFYKRCGKSEKAHSVMKDDLAGGRLPSDSFGVNPIWWWIMILALHLNAVMKRVGFWKDMGPHENEGNPFPFDKLACTGDGTIP